MLAAIDREVAFFAELKESFMAIAGFVFVSSVALYMLEQLGDLRS